EVERLGDLAGVAVHAPGADYELAMVDVASDSLLGVPAAMVRTLAELLSYETEGEGDVLEDVAANWAAEEDMPFGPDEARDYVRRIAELAAGVDPATRSGLFVWTSGPALEAASRPRGGAPSSCQVEILPVIWHNEQV